jgi:hypothetical protein
MHPKEGGHAKRHLYANAEVWLAKYEASRGRLGCLRLAKYGGQDWT